MTSEEALKEAKRSRGFIRAAETQLTKVVTILESLVGQEEPDPEPIPEPEPEVPEDDYPSPPDPTVTLNFSSGTLNLSGRIGQKQGDVTRIVGNRDTVIAELGNIKQGTVVLEGVTLKKTIYGQGGRAWMIDVDCHGTPFNSERPNDWIYPAPSWNLSKTVHIRGSVQHFQRGSHGYVEWYGTHFENMVEDLFQGRGIIRDVTARRIGWPDHKPGAHPDVLQPFGKTDVDGLAISEYRGQGIALGHSGATGSSFKNIIFQDAKDVDDPWGHGVRIETSSGSTGPSNIVFENVECEKNYTVTWSGGKGWKGENIRFINCQFANKSGDWDI